MKNRIMCFLLMGTMLLSISGCEKNTETNTNYKEGNPWINSDIEENVKENYDVSLKDDFALFVNKDWTLNNPLEAGEARKDYLSSFETELQNRLIGIATDSTYENNHDAELVSTYYNAFLDWDARDAAGVEPLMPYIEKIESINTLEDLYAYATGVNMASSDIYEWEITVSPEDSTRSIVFITSPRTFLNDTADYENLDNMDEYTQLVDQTNKAMVKAVLSKCGYSDEEIDAIYAGSIEFERIFCQYCYTNDEFYLTETTDVLNNQLYTPDELSKLEGAQGYLDNLTNWGLADVPQILLNEKIDYFNHLNDIFCEENVEIMKDFLLAHTAVSAIDELDKDLYYQYLDISNELNGTTGYKTEEEMAISNTSSYLGWPLSKLYCDKYVTADDKQNVNDIISKTIDEYKLMISEEDFLSEETKINAIKKLDNLVIKCMYPDEWYDYSELELTGTYFDMCVEISRFDIQDSIDKFYEPIDREKWQITPIEINAFYKFKENSINILPGLVGDVLYNDDMKTEEVYAMLGVVIGHEISHGFDPNGSLYDEVGNYSDWWTKEDYEAFDALTKKLVDYYDGITIWDGFNCNGELVKGEACADMAGVACMLRLAAKEDDFDYDLFFKSYAKLWATNSSPNMDYYVGEYDEHPLNYLRVNVVVAQFDEFYETYDIKEGDGMYIAPENRVKIW